MEQSKHSEVEIIQLGEKLVKELNLEYSVNTLARWLSHYLAELILNIDNSVSKEERKKLQQECCDVILKLWSQKENLPIKQPLEDLKPVLEVLSVLKEKKEVFIRPSWLEYRPFKSHDNEWATFVDLVKNNSEIIFSKIVQINLNKDILKKDQEWMKENKGFLNEDQIYFLEIIDVMIEKNLNKGVVDLNNFDISKNNQPRINFIFDELENLIDEQKKELMKLKAKFLNQE